MQADSFWTIVRMLGFFHPELVPEMTPANRRSCDDTFFDPFCACAVLGRATTIPLGIGVTDATRRAAPDVARATLTLQQLCKGGFNLGVGSGEAMNLTPLRLRVTTPRVSSRRFVHCWTQAGRQPVAPCLGCRLPRTQDGRRSGLPVTDRECSASLASTPTAGYWSSQ